MQPGVQQGALGDLGVPARGDREKYPGLGIRTVRHGGVHRYWEGVGPPLSLTGTPVRTPWKSERGSPRWIPLLSNMSSRMLSSWAPLLFFTTEMAFFTLPSFSK